MNRPLSKNVSRVSQFYCLFPKVLMGNCYIIAVLDNHTFLYGTKDSKGKHSNFAHPALKELIHKFFFDSPKSLGLLFPDSFSGGLSQEMLALTATVVWSCNNMFFCYWYRTSFDVLLMNGKTGAAMKISHSPQQLMPLSTGKCSKQLIKSMTMSTMERNYGLSFDDGLALDCKRQITSFFVFFFIGGDLIHPIQRFVSRFSHWNRKRWRCGANPWLGGRECHVLGGQRWPFDQWGLYVIVVAVQQAIDILISWSSLNVCVSLCELKSTTWAR